jgi:3-hydroxybutyryl-CoA dehydrogenase
VLQEERVVAGRLGRKSGRGFYEYADGATRSSPASVSSQPPPKRLVVCGDLGIAAPLARRFDQAGLAVEQASADEAFPDGAIRIGDAMLALSDGRTATSRAAKTSVKNLVLHDLALDYARCNRLGLARSDTCALGAFETVAGALQAAGIAVSPLDDVAGMVVLRTVAALANEAADAVTHGVASVRDVDLAMQKGVNYPRGPLQWADQIGVSRVRDVLVNLARHYGEDRYRLSPLIARRHAAGRPLAEPAA